MSAFINWITSGVTFLHLIAIVALIILLALGVGPQEAELLGLFGLVGLAIPTGSSSTVVDTTAVEKK